MGKLFFMENPCKPMKSKIGKSGASVRVLFEKMENPEEITKYIYGTESIRMNPWSEGVKRAHYTAYLQVGELSTTMSMQELCNLAERLNQVINKQDRILSQESMEGVF